jgi:hypothetical protein
MMDSPMRDTPSPTTLNQRIRFPEGVLLSTTLGELNAQGCTDIPDLSLPNLKNPIIPLFSARNFQDFSKAEYAYISPALHLASRFVTDESHMAFWRIVHHAYIETEYRDGEEVRRLQQSTSLTRSPDKAVKDKETGNAMGKLARGIKFVNMTKEMAKEYPNEFGRPYLETGGKTKAKSSKRGENGEGATAADVSTFRIGLHPDLQVYIKQVLEQKRPIESEDMRFQLLIARTLVCGIVHFFYHQTHPGSVFLEEPFFNSKEQQLSEEADLGPANLATSWQIYAFGCTISQWHHAPPLKKTEPQPGMARSTFLYTSHTVDTGIDLINTHIAVLSTPWISAWFQQATWDSIHEKGSPMALEIVRLIGGPELDNAPILIATDPVSGEDDDREWTVERFNHRELAEHGGYQTDNEPQRDWIYGTVGTSDAE